MTETVRHIRRFIEEEVVHEIDPDDSSAPIRLGGAEGDGMWVSFVEACDLLRVLPDLITQAAEEHGFEIPEDILEEE